MLGFLRDLWRDGWNDGCSRSWFFSRSSKDDLSFVCEDPALCIDFWADTVTVVRVEVLRSKLVGQWYRQLYDVHGVFSLEIRDLANTVGLRARSSLKQDLTGNEDDEDFRPWRRRLLSAMKMKVLFAFTWSSAVRASMFLLLLAISLCLLLVSINFTNLVAGIKTSKKGNSSVCCKDSRE
ncbi:hypothetical protein L1987_06954 [Smallanthus sonchifolius]|uniref:Uncharacterized protein n=1 Tax=Smallanthus sonchifolius TaxID=185202 RepID=A0ACB9JZI0_9ASTR|nr:hypothetical protein L1987_06954 [Smallanthus sonchifolius]